MFDDARSVETGSVLDPDVCIIGGGAAGITLAREFADSSVRVVVLESGAFEFDEDTHALNEGPSIGIPYGSLTLPRLRFLGGSTNHWGGLCRAWEEADFEARDGIPFSGWPIRRADLTPFYEAAESIVSLPSQGEDLDDLIKRSRFSPLKLNGDRIVNRVVEVVPRDVRSFGVNYREELRQARNVTVYLRANVTGIDTNEAGSTATSTEVMTLSGNRFKVEARLFILAVGALENPRLLLVSNRRWPKGLGNQNDLVGRFFAEHPRYIGGVIVPSDPYMSVGFYDIQPVGDAVLRGYLATSKELQLAEGLLDMQFRPEPVYDGQIDGVTDSSDVDSALTVARNIRDGELSNLGPHVTNVLADLMTWQKFIIPGAPIPVPYPELLAELVGSTRREAELLMPSLLGDVATRAYVELGRAPIASIPLSTRWEQVPNPDSRVVLIDERDELGIQRIGLDWRLTDIDKRIVRRSLEVLGAEVGAAGIGRLNILYGENEPGWPEDLNGGQHLMGTTRMSDDPKQGVVDRNCRVHGMSNLFVAGSSVFSTAGGGTPTLTLVVLALRLAEHLKRMML